MKSPIQDCSPKNKQADDTLTKHGENELLIKDKPSTEANRPFAPLSWAERLKRVFK